MVARFSLCYELESFSLGRAADLIVQYTERLRGQALRVSAQGLDRDELRVRLGDLFLQLRALICCASPILIDLSAQAARSGGFELRMSASAFALSHTAPFPVPGLALRVAPTTV
jgi:methionyl-tRNA synthetase